VLAGTGVVFLSSAGASLADDSTEELRRLIQEQGKQIQELKQQLEVTRIQTASQTEAVQSGTDKAKIDDAAVKKIVSEYLKENPGAGMPPSVRSGYQSGQGFLIRSAPDLKFVKWDDECRIRFELQFRGRIQLDYYRYKTTDLTNHINNRFQTLDIHRSPAANWRSGQAKHARPHGAGQVTTVGTRIAASSGLPSLHRGNESGQRMLATKEYVRRLGNWQGSSILFCHRSGWKVLIVDLPLRGHGRRCHVGNGARQIRRRTRRRARRTHCRARSTRGRTLVHRHALRDAFFMVANVEDEVLSRPRLFTVVTGAAPAAVRAARGSETFAQER
jgi:hypothetical protein